MIERIRRLPAGGVEVPIADEDAFVAVNATLDARKPISPAVEYAFLGRLRRY
ncbi:hypothetical protein ACFO9N_03895 [Halostagnicola sp. GCM10023243]